MSRPYRSLTSILNSAAGICKTLTSEGIRRSGGAMGLLQTGNSRSGEAFCSEVQQRVEDCVIQDDIQTRKAAREEMKKKRKKGEKQEHVSGMLVELALKAFLSHIRAYPTKEKPVRHIFSPGALHLGRIARSFALKDQPKKVGTTRKRKADDDDDDEKSAMKKSQKMKFGFGKEKDAGNAVPKKIQDGKSAKNPRNSRALLMANAVNLQNVGLDGL
jgi:hypothetical protein